MNSKKEQINSENINETDPSSTEEQINSENTNEIEKIIILDGVVIPK